MTALKRLGLQTVKMGQPPHIITAACIVGPKEGEGPLGAFFDEVLDDEMYGEKSWERAEMKLVKNVFSKLIKNTDLKEKDLNYLIAGDLLNQSFAANFGLRETNVPFFGVFGACSTMSESMSIGAMLIDGGFAEHLACITSSHFCSAEKQFRFPLEQGTQRAPVSQWTVTGSGGVILSSRGQGPCITHITTGKIIDMGITDANNMGSAMAPAAADTLIQHFADTGRTPSYYDLIVTGDLGFVGKEICRELMADNGFTMGDNYNDCGTMIFDPEKQAVHSGASGCGCAASVFAGYIYSKLKTGELKRVLLTATGALLSPTSTQQGESIPSIAHAVAIEVL